MVGHAVWLRDRGVVRVSGPEAASFLQGVLTNDVETVAAGEARYAALLTPQGKILFDFLVVRLADDAGFALDVAGDRAAELAKRLSFYKLRAKVAVVDASANEAVVAVWGETRTTHGVDYADPRATGLGRREIVTRENAEAVGEAARADYDALRISLGVPLGGVDFAYGDAFPHDANFDWLHGVDFKKGCYVGQEVVSRMQHRGGVRKRVLRVTFAGEPPKPGTPVLDGALPVGTLGASVGREALALVRTDRVEEARQAGRPLTAEGVALEVAATVP